MSQNRKKSHTNTKRLHFFWTPTQRQQFLTRTFSAKKKKKKKVTGRFYSPEEKGRSIRRVPENTKWCSSPRPKFTALTFWKHLNVFLLFYQIKDDWKHCSCLERLLLIVLENKIQHGSLPWHWKPCFPNPLKNKQEKFLIFCWHHILSQLYDKAFYKGKGLHMKPNDLTGKHA